MNRFHLNKIHSPGYWRGHYGAPRGRWPKIKKPSWGFRRGLSLIIFTVVLGMFGVGVGGSFFLWYFSRGLPQPGQIAQRQVAQSTKIYDRTGEVLLFDVHGEIKRTAIGLADVPDHAKAAALVAEDKNFYEHRGFDLRGIARAIITNTLRGGKFQGGSTITQQFIKNAVLSPEKTYTRKIKELVMSYKMEQRYSKDQILEMYFNEIPYGSTTYGIEAAAETFFGKHAKDLDLGESVLIAAIAKAPTYYSPYGSHRDDLVARMNYILNEMVREGYVVTADSEKINPGDVLATVKQRRENIVAPHFVMYIRELLAEKYGERVVEQGGLTVITSLDIPKQEAAEKAITDNKKLINSFGATNAALVSLDVPTGQILAMVGSLDYFDPEIDGNVNVTVRPRQPGSSFKPIVYAASFIKGYTPTTSLYDVNTVFKTEIGKDYEPKNYDQKEHGPVTVRQALAGSLNIPAVKMIYLTGIGNVLDLAEKMGYSTFADRSRFGLSLVLGGGEVRLLEHTNAFGVFAREGSFTAPAAILRVQNARGEVLEEWKEVAPLNVFEPQIARQISSILSDNAARAFIFGEQNYLTLPDRPIAAKTGTTNDFRDAWTIGYTPSLVTGVWVGNNNNDAMGQGADGSRIAAPIWNQYMRSVLVSREPEKFTEPTAVITGKPVLDGQLGGEIILKVDRISGGLATENTPKQTTVEQTYRQLHNILFFIHKDDPRGPDPVNPNEDLQFSNWESAVNRWAEAQGIINELPPREFDNVHTPLDKPVVRIQAPSDNEIITSSDLSLSVDASSRRGIRRIEIFIDEDLVDTTLVDGNSVVNKIIPISSDIPNGFHNLGVFAFDDIQNNSSAKITFNLLRN